MSKDSRSGGKYCGNHTTLIPAAALLCDIAHKCLYVTKISLGLIKPGLPPANGRRRVKILDEGKDIILLCVRDNTSHQEVRVYTSNIHEARLTIARAVRNAGMHLSFH